MSSSESDYVPNEQDVDKYGWSEKMQCKNYSVSLVH